MCGLAGFLSKGVATRDGAILQSMAVSIRHRGPDDEGLWLDAEQGIGLGHRRLSVLDLSPAGHQPMSSPTGRYITAYNGEIYNHLDLRRELAEVGAEPAWRGHSDTETLLAAFESWGIENTIKRCVGMFAMAVWDRQAKTLFLLRDRAGEKPLYYGWQGDAFVFASDLIALEQHPSFRKQIDRRALSLYMRLNYVPAPYSIYEGISKLPAASCLTVSLRDRKPKITPYWSAEQAAIRGRSTPFQGTKEEAIDGLERLLRQAVKAQTLSDVHVGAFLSGGIDSSTVVALMQAQSSSAVRTFTIGYEEDGYSEAADARAIAHHLGTDHTELSVTSADALAVIPRLPELYSEPFSDSSQLPTFLVSRLARQQVTVTLSGDGGDELFCGYNRYQFTAKYWNYLSRVPRPVRHGAAKLILSRSPHWWSRRAAFLPWTSVGDKLHKGAAVLNSSSVSELYAGLVSSWRDPSQVVRATSARIEDELFEATSSELTDIEKMMVLDTKTYLADDILVKLDRAAMAVSLESRVPYLDHRLIEFAWTLPMQYKLQGGETKWILREVLHRYVPRHLVDRPKSGFGFPIDLWLRTTLRPWAEELLRRERMDREGYFHTGAVHQKWQEHVSGRRNWASQLWAVLMFQAWLDR